ncbi:dTDP-glucose pyrophosphorylase/predicted transcriptional regulator [Paenibacillus sp. 4624]|uniref:Alcohol dehydrogenase n=1 Tax=Paenibacillus amylolyticus TaxID=1451 RepID=A0A5M9WW11_PAEAM|nr:nucleotidyltransferase family protein [Paenibacillus amylolyticus]KAA8785583.1 alcohol dehydrogenase [Paenibacillus amylolyticus]
MKLWEKVIVQDDRNLLETMKVINESSLQFAVVVDNNGCLLGTVTDGDIRRGLLKGYGLDVSIKMIMNSNPVSELAGQHPNVYKHSMSVKRLRQLPIVNKQNKVVDVLFADRMEHGTKHNKVVLMLGGLGTRLRPLTNEIPKPMLKVGNKPILETIVDGFKQFGFSQFIFSVNYKKEIIKDYFLNGEAHNINIDYIEEEKRMGTAGALSLLTDRPKEPFFVMNGDLLTQINFQHLMQFHIEQDAIATMCVREYQYQIPYGVVETDGTNLININEKPVHCSFVNAGVYVLDAAVFDYIPHGEFYDMPTLFKELVANGEKVAVFPIHEYWLDIGQITEFEQADREYQGIFRKEELVK